MRHHPGLKHLRDIYPHHYQAQFRLKPAKLQFNNNSIIWQLWPVEYSSGVLYIVDVNKQCSVTLEGPIMASCGPQRVKSTGISAVRSVVITR